MINLSPNLLTLIKRQHGAATLMMTVLLMVAAVLIIIYATSHSVLQQKGATNQYASNQAFEAADAGLEMGIAYLKTNRALILASPVGGFITYGPADTNITNITLGNSSSYSIVYTNPTASNYTLIKITSTGTSVDGTSTRTVSQMVQYKPLLTTIPSAPATILGAVTLGGNPSITTNFQHNKSIISGSTISYAGSASSSSNDGTSDKHGAGPDISQNTNPLNTETADQFFQSYFGTTAANVKAGVSNFYAAGTTPALDGLTGVSIWVDGPYSQTGNVTIGSAVSPVLLIVNGDFSIGGNVTIYGFVFVYGNTSSSSGTPNIIGGLASSGTLSIQGNGNITYDNSLLTTTQSSTGSYPKVPGTWKDF